MNDRLKPTPEQAAISVSQLNRRAKQLLEQGIARIWVEGEISNIARPASGHLYFSLKDDTAQVRAAFFRQRQRGPTVNLKNGDNVLAFGKVSLYEARGDYQLIVERVEPAGEGALKREYDRLRRKLEAEGLFDEDRKLELPELPEQIGIITSPSGAAVRDVLTVLRRRFPAIPVVIYPAAVQGEAAPGELMQALADAIRRDECDVLIVGRGGGSLEDLWAFNNEDLARAIADCPIPIVSAVGHEVDFTITDFVADLRAPTPTAAAELVVPDRDNWLRLVNRLAGRVARLGQRALEDRAQALDYLSRRLLGNSPAASVVRQADQLRGLRARLANSGRQQTITNVRLQMRSLHARLITAVQRDVIEPANHRLQLTMRSLHAVSPLATLDRGYAIVLDDASGKALTKASETAVGADIRARLHSGEVVATVKEVRDGD